MYILTLLGLATILGLAGPDANTTRLDLQDDDGVPTVAQGVWLSEESGWILDIGEAGIQRWQVTPAACYPSSRDGPTLMGQIEYRYFTSLDPDSARFEYLSGDGHAVFQRLAQLPADCTFDADTSPVAVFDAFTTIFASHYAHFERRDVDWDRLTEDTRARIDDSMDEAALFDALAAMLEPLGDSHTKLIAEIEGAPRRAQFGLGETLPRIDETLGGTPWLIGLIQQLFADVLDDGAQHIANDRVIAGTIEGRVGYLQFFTMGGFTTEHEAGSPEWSDAELQALDTLLDEQIARFADMDAVILDLSNNRGGYDAICRAIAGRFTDTAFTGYTVSTQETGPELAHYLIEPDDGPRFTGPLYVLTSDVTVSCGEITALMLNSLPQTIQVGATTRGAFSTPLAKPLPNGWYLELSNEIFANAHGEVFEGRGLAPDIEIHPFPEESPIGGHAAAINAILADIDAE